MADDVSRLRAALADRYTLERELGRGAMATVWLAQDVKHERPVALKILRPELAAALGPERFLREIHLTARLTHPHILPLHDSGVADGFLFYVMPYVDGESLRDRLNREKQLPLDEALQIAREVADALSYAHSHDVVHRDIKPENILLEAGHAVVADFGIARAISAAGGDRLTETGIAVGTPAYMSPEQGAGSRELDGRSDLYSLGCVLYEMLAGHPPYTGSTVQEVLARHSMDAVPPLTPARPTVPPHVERAISTALAKVPADRYATAARLVRALDDQSSVTAARSVARRSGWRRRAALAGVGTLVAVLAGAWWAFSAGRGSSPTPSGARIGVFPFAVPRGEEFDGLGEGLMDLLSGALDDAGEVRAVDPNALMSRVSRRQNGGMPIDLDDARRIAGELGVSHFVLGRVVDLRGTVRITASLYAGPQMSEPDLQAVREGSIRELRGLVDSLARDILAHLPLGPGGSAASPSVAPTSSYSALRAYLRGLAFRRRHQMDSSCTALRYAVREDSAFALAWLALAEYWNWGCEQGGTEAERFGIATWHRAYRLRDRLSPRDRAWFEAAYAYAQGRGGAAERAALAMVDAYPDAIQGWMYLGMSRLDLGWQFGRSVTTADSAFERALALDPGDQLVMNYLALVRYVQGRKAEGDSLWVRGWGSRWLPPEDSAGRRRYFAALESRPRASVINRVWAISEMADSLVDAVRVAALLTDPARAAGSDLAAAHLLGAWVEVARGRWSAADSQFRRAAAASPGRGVLEQAWFSALPLLDLDSLRLRGIRDSLIGWVPPRTYGVATLGIFSYFEAGQLPKWLVPHFHAYVLGLLSARIGDVDAAARYATRLESARAPPDSIGLLRDLGLEVRALAAATKEDWDSCLRILEGARLEAAFWQRAPLLVSDRPFGRMLRAEALYRLGRHEEALAWYGTLWLAKDFVWISPVRLRQGQIHEQLGHRDEAVHYYRRFLARWRDADPHYQPLLRDVQARIARLTGQRGG